MEKSIWKWYRYDIEYQNDIDSDIEWSLMLVISIEIF